MTDDGPALLVVDDNDDNRYTLTRRLKREGDAAPIRRPAGNPIS